MARKVAVYIDGFNYYYAIMDYLYRNPGWASLKWLDYRKLVEDYILKKVSYDKNSLKINFYTAINTYRDIDSQQRHDAYLQALKKSKINVQRGKYKLREIFLSCHLDCTDCRGTTYIKKYQLNCEQEVRCARCNKVLELNKYRKAQHPEEKQTDVNIAKDMIIDCLEEGYDTVYLFSTDSDFVPVAKYLIEQKGISFNVVRPLTMELRDVWVEKEGKKIKQTESVPRYEINSFTEIGCCEFGLKLGKLCNYQFSNPYQGLRKPHSW